MAAAEKVYLATPIASGRGDVIASPFQWLFTGEDVLRAVLVNSQAGVIVTMQGRFLPLKAGKPQPFVQSFTPTTDRLSSTFDFGFGDGFLLNCSFTVTAGTPVVGQTYVMLQIARGSSGAKTVLGCLLGGYITAMQHVAYPGSPIQSSTEGEPYVRTITGTNPPAATEIVETVPPGARWELLSARAVLVTDATIINRRVLLSAVLSGAQPVLVLSADVQGANRATSYSWGQALNALAATSPDVIQQALPTGVKLAAGTAVQTATVNMQAGDNWAAADLLVREWLEAA